MVRSGKNWATYPNSEVMSLFMQQTGTSSSTYLVDAKQNGDVPVVVGCDKATSWGMATLAKTSSAQQNFHPKFHPLGGQQQPQHSAGAAYAWEHSGVAEEGGPILEKVRN